MDSTPLVLDNGSYEIKFGLSNSERPYRALNGFAVDKYGSAYLSNQMKKIQEVSEVTLRRPHELGQLTSWELESCIWDYCLYNPDEFDGFELGGSGKKHLIVSEPCMTLPELSKNMDQVIFEEYEFDSLFKAPTAGYIPFGVQADDRKVLLDTISGKKNDDDMIGQSENVTISTDNLKDDKKKFSNDYQDYELVIDSGFNCTWIIPMIKGVPYYKAIKKLDIGGRFLTGLLKETLSFRHYDLMDETLLVNNIKEKCLFVSPTSYFDSFKAKEETSVEYILPDISSSYLGYTRENKSKPLPEGSQVVKLYDELFSVPETFFHPEISRILKPGIVETILESLSMIPEILRPLLVANIVCTGGNFNLPHFAARLAAELQRQLPTDWTCRISVPKKECELFSWKSMCQFANTDSYKKTRISKEEYYEHGPDWLTKHKFGYQNWL
ncbi:Arp6p NDAI_0B01960 [Naumovozyma dairenensis CBS 421]|uniref:Actin-like protein ARP6 n=1 Tax=Naumovozyma dairenensis (strain ATCC 10597 / BCRC 20456 / CBS 421 / NBRC 0211 / NRRL Y-12639) TaxID=1071378 RepID=G0W620_NAUDC|nr:hypothetical protein NDAI_0B01960 [Naumovozyma dairenensis CBS 421]CCD23231.1 hypothetical protein NDAI_0B01960 [Naumovozyma dairenensis CBS 421]